MGVEGYNRGKGGEEGREKGVKRRRRRILEVRGRG